MHYKIWSDSFLLYLGFVPRVYPLALTFLAPFLFPLHNLCRIISSQHTYDLQCICYHNCNKSLCSFFFQLLWCQPYRLWKTRGNNTSIFIFVTGMLLGCHNFAFLANLNAFSNESGSQKQTSCWILSFKVLMNTSILCSSGTFFTLMFNFWNSSMCYIIEPFRLRLINWLKKVLLFVSS